MTPETLALLLRTPWGLRFEGYSEDGLTGSELVAWQLEQRKEAAVNMERNLLHERYF